jgi:O-antigen ligase
MSKYISFRAALRILCIIFLCAASCFFLFDFQSAAPFISYPVYFLSLLGFLVSLRSLAGFGFFLVFLAAVMPFFPPIAVYLSMQLLLLARLLNRPAEANTLRNFDSLGLLLLAGIFVLGFARSLAAEIDFDLLSTFYNAGDLLGFISYVETSNRTLYQSGFNLLGFVLMVLLAAQIAFVKHEQTFRKGVVAGIVASAVVVGVVLALQVFNLVQILSYNRGAFWVLTQRYAATFADPNSFGIAAALLLILAWVFVTRELVGRSRYLLLAAVSLLSVSALWSGSRSFVLVLVLYVLSLGGCYLRAKKRLLPALLLLGLGAAVLVYPATNTALQEKINLPTVTRILQTANANTFLQMLESRVVFARIALQIWESEPLHGVGLGRFYDNQQRAAETLDIELHSWRDNANNFYLQILAEHGIIGVAMLLLAALLLLAKTFNSNDSLSHRARLGVLLFALLLCTGPHLLFAEIKFLFAILLGLILVPVAPYRSTMQLGAVLLLVALGYLSIVSLAPRVGNSGVYGAERSGDERYFWTAASGKITVTSAAVQDNALRFRVVRPDQSMFPVVVTFVALDAQHLPLAVSSVVVSDDTWQSYLPAEALVEKVSNIKFYVDKTWKPGGDNRHLGIIVDSSDSDKESS